MHYCVNKIPVGVLGASGYAGRELCRAHRSRIRALARLRDGERAARGDRARRRPRRHVTSRPTTRRSTSAELVFSALPHGASKDWVERIREAGARAVDLSADLRPGNGCEGIAYGLTELNRDRRCAAPSVVANPGLLSDVDPPRARAARSTRGLVARRRRRSSPTRRAA